MNRVCRLPTLTHGSRGVVAAALAWTLLEEPLMDAVRTALSAAIARTAPPTPVFADDTQRVVFERWAGTSDDKLVRKKPEELVRREFLQTVWYEAKRAGLDPGLVMGLIEVESGFRKYAISPVGARGYMQVMPFWSRSIGDGNAAALFHMQTNLRFGCVILRHYLDVEKGNLFLALGRGHGRMEALDGACGGGRRCTDRSALSAVAQGVTAPASSAAEPVAPVPVRAPFPPCR